MNRPQYILQPVNPYFIAFSLAAAFLLNLMPWGRLPGVPTSSRSCCCSGTSTNRARSGWASRSRSAS